MRLVSVFAVFAALAVFQTPALGSSDSSPPAAQAAKDAGPNTDADTLPPVSDSDTTAPPSESDSSTPDSDANVSFVRPEGSLSKTVSTTPCDPQFPSKLPVRCWEGQKFVVLPMDKSLRSLGYQKIEGGMSPDGHATYDELAGKVVTVTKVELQRGATVSAWVITITNPETDDTYTTRASILPNQSLDDATVSSFAPLRDLKEAREKYLGKTFVVKTDSLPELAENGSMRSNRIVRFRKASPVKVTDVLASGEADSPVRIVVSNGDGQEAYFDLAVSETNRGQTGKEIGDAAMGQVFEPGDSGTSHK